ncbi:MAG: zinc-binding dehydrogenase [Bdellovibrionales bacterium]|nr:zinc-binding dehydrogenase [Bdellovibrionales bacterium]
MKAIFFEQHGGPEVLRYGDLPDPELESGQALIRVRAVALNHLDIWVRRGWKGLRLSMPHITGSDVAGEVVSVKGSDTTWSAGDRVIVNPGILLGEDEFTRTGRDSVSPGYRVLGEHLRGGLAELVAVPARNVFRLPENVSFSNGAAPLLVATTAWRMLVHCAHLRAGQTVLVVGSGGGVNSVAVQLAEAMGAHVICLAGGLEKARKVKKLGAEDVLDYHQFPQWHVEVLKLTKGRGVDLVIDNVGQETIEKSIRAASRGGKIVTVGNTSGHDLQIDNRLIFTKQLSLIGSTMGSRQDFIDVLKFMWKRGIQPVIDSIEPLKNGVESLIRMEKGDHFGKLVLEP